MFDGKPVIGLTCSYRLDAETEQHFLNQSYLEAIRHFGGIPLILPVHAGEAERVYLLKQCDGLLLTGGNDMDPGLFGEEIINDTVVIAPERDREEYLQLEIAVRQKLPILGICRGIQVMNVYFGGTLYQDIPTQIPSEIAHRMEKPYHRTCHSCLLEKDAPLHIMTGEARIGVNSHHHQAIQTIAPGFRAMGRCEDGIIEAIWDPREKFRWGVQWHPERIWDIEESSAKIFEAFIDACKA